MPRVSPAAAAEQRQLPPAAPPPPSRMARPLPDRPGRWKLAARRWRRGLRPPLLASLAVLLALVWLVAANVGSGAMWRTRLGALTAGLGFRIAHIEVAGNAKTPQAAILEKLHASEGSPTLAVALETARTDIETLAWIRSARVERILPDTIRVTVTERSPVAVWQLKGEKKLIDRGGLPVTDSDVQSFKGKLPLVVGEGANAAAVALIDLLATQPELRARLVAAIRIGGRRWNLCLDSGAELLLPEGAEAQALSRIAELQASHRLLERPLREIDLRLPDQLRVRPLTDGGCVPAPGPASAPSGSQAAAPPVSRKDT